MNSLSRSPSLKRQMRPVLVVVGFPALEFASQISFIMKRLPSVELFRVGFVASLHLAVDLRASGGNVTMRDAQVRKVPGELRTE